MIVTGEAAAIELLRALNREEREMGFDTETYGITLRGVEYSALQLNRARLLSFQIDSVLHGSLVFLSKKVGPAYLDFHAILPALKVLCENPKVRKIFHNANYDGYVLYNHGIRVRNVYCTMIAGACQDENMANGLKERAVLVGMLLKQMKTINLKDAADFAQYGGDDAVGARRLKILYSGKEGAASAKVLRIGKQLVKVPAVNKEGLLQGKRKLFFEEQEMPMLHLMLKMEKRGARIDLPRLAAIHKQIEVDKQVHLKKVYQVAGKVFNLNSVAQLREFLFKKLSLQPEESCYTKKGDPSTDARSLFYLAPQHAIVTDLIEYRKLEKLQSVYTDPAAGLPYHCDEQGYIHSTANNVGTHTFRFSYSNPNLQTIPSKRDKYGIRACFIAPDGYSVAVFDYSQIEVRMQAIFSQDPIMLEELNKKDGDIYLRTAREFGSPDPADERQMYKIVVLALQYGMGPWNLADQMTQAGYPMSAHQARQKIDTYFKQVYAGIPRMWYDLFQEHLRRGFVTTLLGRPRKVKDFETSFSLDSGMLKLNSTERALVNNVCQGSVADYIKQAMLRIDRSLAIRKTGYRQVLQIHDEVLGIIPTERADAFELVTQEAVVVPKAPFAPTRDLIVNIKVEGGVGPNWKEAKP